MNHDHSRHEAEPTGFWGSRYSIGLLVIGAVAMYFLLTEHRAHFFGALPFLILLACPLMHVFMHGGHGHGGHAGGNGHHQGGPPQPDTSAPPLPQMTGDQP